MGIQSMESTDVVSKSVPSVIHVSLDLRQFITGLPSTRSGSDKTCLIINTNKCFTLPFFGQIRIFSVVFSFGS